MPRFVVSGSCLALALGGLVACSSDNGDPAALEVARSEQIVPPSATPVPTIGPEIRPIPGKKITVGSVEAMRDLFIRSESRHAKRFMLPSSEGDVPVVAEDYRWEHDELTITGTIEGSEDSELYLTAGGRRIQGWVVRGDQGAAFVYDTGAGGNVEVEKLPVQVIWGLASPLSAAVVR